MDRSFQWRRYRLILILVGFWVIHRPGLAEDPALKFPARVGASTLLPLSEIAEPDEIQGDVNSITHWDRPIPPSELEVPIDRVSNVSGRAEVVTSDPSRAWWNADIVERQRETASSLGISVNSLLVGAIAHSARVQVLSDTPLISETALTIADSAFDWTSFLDTRWDDTSDPVGNTLTTGGPSRLRDHRASAEAGLKRKNTLGGDFRVGQRVGHQNSNSLFFIPNDQGTSRLTLNYTQPLMRGAGHVYNTSLTVLAKLDIDVAMDDFSRQLQDHLLEVTEAYWGLVLERGKLAQRQQLIERGVLIQEELNSRHDVDALQSQIVRANSAIATRRANFVRAQYDIRSAEAKIRSLVNDPALGTSDQFELIPEVLFDERPLPINLAESVEEALRKRPEITLAIKQIKGACVRMQMSKNETLPMLNVILETYVAGLEGRTNIGRALEEQFAEGEPSYSVGLQYEYPIWNRGRGANLQKRRLEVRRLQSQFRNSLETVKMEVEVTVNELQASFETLQARYQAMDAARRETEYLYDRWKLLPDDNGNASLMLEDLLDAQDRLGEAEFGALEASLNFNLSQIRYKKAIGVLLDLNYIESARDCECNLPRQQLYQSQPPIEQHSTLPLIPTSGSEPPSFPLSTW